MSHEMILLVSAAFGVVFLVTRIVLAVLVPEPTPDQASVFRTVLALAAAGIGVVIPGLLNFESKVATTTVSATGALAIFAMVYLINPGVWSIVSMPRSSRKTAEQRRKELVEKISRNAGQKRDGAMITFPSKKNRILFYAFIIALIVLFLSSLGVFSTASKEVINIVAALFLGLFSGMYAFFAPEPSPYASMEPPIAPMPSRQIRIGLSVAVGCVLGAMMYFVSRYFA